MDENSQKVVRQENSLWTSWPFFILMAVILIVITGAYGRYVYNSFGSFDKAGTFGDSFGALTSLFTALAFAGLIFTLFVQKRELSLQRLEFENLVQEQKSSNKILENQSQSIYRQNFETTFFNMVREFRSVRDAAAFRRTSTSEFTGQHAIEVMSNVAFGKISKIGVLDFDDEYLNFYTQHVNDLGPYFRMLYSIFKFVHESEIQDKKFYTNILRAQLSSGEAQLLMINCVSPLGKEKFLPLVKEYDLLKHYVAPPQICSDGGRYYASFFEGSSFLDGVYLGQSDQS